MEFSLFRPTPPDLMRDLSPDRPDKTESPYTVDAGHLQLEMDFVTFARDRSEEVTVESWNITPVNVKVGLLNNIDFQLVFDNYSHVRTDERRLRKTTVQSGFGDLTARLKLNVWGNDGGQTAFGVLPFMKFPTSTDHLGNDSIEGGVIFPFAANLPLGFDMGLETGLNVFRDEETSGYHAEFINSVTFGHSLVANLRGYVEFFSNVSTERDATWLGTLDVGIGYELSKNITLDGGCNFGLTNSAPDLNPFTGITIRF